ncbi:MAG TPA: aspartate-semialdehyde dehydrogenase, partial [Tenuifilaceae bacterium]|nr:aspartate-semialdehyde dehydrogenase [Tenuifilaceae bacterium]
MKVAVVGATGLVGQVMLRVLEQRNFPVTELIPVASEKSVGKTLKFKNEALKVSSLEDAVRQKPSLALFSA